MDTNFQATKTKMEDGRGVWMFERRVQYARELIYELARPNTEGDGVVRHKDLESQGQRQQVGISIALLYLVSQLDHVLNFSFRQLWESRRERLHVWVEGQLGNVLNKAGKDAPESEPADDGNWLKLDVRFDRLWAGTSKSLRLEDYFKKVVLKRWDRKSPKRKIDFIERILLNDEEEGDAKAREDALARDAEASAKKELLEARKSWPPEREQQYVELEKRTAEILRDQSRRHARLKGHLEKPKKARAGGIPLEIRPVLDEAFNLRNEFAHPDMNDLEPGGQFPFRATTRASWNLEKFAKAAEAFIVVAGWVHRRTAEVVGHGWLATNVQSLDRSLTDQQVARLWTYIRGCGDHVKTVTELLAAIKKNVEGSFGPPKIMVLDPNEDVLAHLGSLETFLADYPRTPIVMYEGAADTYLNADDREKLMALDRKYSERFYLVPRWEFDVLTERHPEKQLGGYKAEEAFKATVKRLTGA